MTTKSLLGRSSVRATASFSRWRGYLVAALVAAGCAPLYALPGDYYVCAGNQASVKYEVYDPAVTDWNSGSALKWSFAPTTAGGWTSSEVAAYSNPSDMKLRWAGSSQVVVSCASGGLATLATYPGGTMVWANNIGGSYNPHSVERLPNGNVAVAASAGNFVRVYAASQGNRNNTYASYTLSGAHGVLWDPQNNVLWAVGDTVLVSLSVGGTAGSPSLSQVASYALPGSGGHDVSATWGDPNSLWVTTSLNVYQFQKSTGSWYAAPGSVNRSAIKGCGDQPSGEIAQCQVDKSGCTLNTWCTHKVDFFTPSGTLDYSRTRTSAAFYKCRIFCPDYQPRIKALIGGDFDGDGYPDLVQFCDTTGWWAVRFSHDGSVHNFQFGQAGDIGLMNGDFDGDGVPDAVLFRPSTGYWYVRFSRDASIHSFQFGANGDIPLLGGDYTGEGVPDAVLFRPSNNTWYVRFSPDGSVHSFGFGNSTDIPLLNGDFTGDGMPDSVLFRPSSGYWYVRNSLDGSVTSDAFGQNGDKPLLGGDFDGDGVPDFVLFRPANVTWYVRNSSTGAITSFGMGRPGDTPLMNGDFDGDLAPDAVLYRPYNRMWYIRFSSDGSVHSFWF